MAHTDTIETFADQTMRLREREDGTADVYLTPAGSRVERMVGAVYADGTAWVARADDWESVHFDGFNPTALWAATRLVHLYR